MKNSYLIIILSFCAISQAQIINIPDANFKNALINHSPVIDTNEDGEIQVSEAEAALNLNVYSKNISSLEGIQYFINLQVLNCRYNNIIHLDLSQNINLTILNCANNALSSLDISENINLRSFYCRYNQLSNLDLSQNINLEDVDCSNNQLTSLNLSQTTQIWSLSVYENNLIYLDVRDCSILEWIWADNNQLESFDISQNPHVFYMTLHNNNLMTLNIKNGHNTSLQLIDTRENPTLSCIQVDNVNYPNTRRCDGNTDFWCMGPPNWNPNSYYSEDCSLSSEDFTKVDFSINPNPVKDILMVNSQESIDFLKIYSTTGKLLKETRKTNINVSGLTSGLYFVMVSIEGKTDTKKFIKI